MKEEKYLEVESFYLKVAEILGTDRNIKPIRVPKRSLITGVRRLTDKTRWGPREPGNGRYEGFGMVRVFGDKVHVALRHPASVHRMFETKEDAIEFLQKLMLV